MRSFCIAASSLFLLSSVQGVFVLEGRYNGENLKFYSPAVDVKGTPCLDSVRVNGVSLTLTDLGWSDSADVYVLDFTKLNLNIGDDVWIMPYWSGEDCLPIVMNPDAISKK